MFKKDKNINGLTAIRLIGGIRWKYRDPLNVMYIFPGLSCYSRFERSKELHSHQYQHDVVSDEQQIGVENFNFSEDVLCCNQESNYELQGDIREENNLENEYIEKSEKSKENSSKQAQVWYRASTEWDDEGQRFKSPLVSSRSKQWGSSTNISSKKYDPRRISRSV